ncbi:MAG: 3-phosphoshikimate 1-carboxyvinyltransferase [Algicola sp.]|nr:3-phosphoshikimate 1-carboxyvinyltransferase [Algicola sp.]
MDQLTLEPIKSVSGTVNLPGSKSLSNRALLLAALANGTTTLNNLLDSDDVSYMLGALTKLGISYQLSEDKTQCVVQGNGGVFSQPASNKTEPLELFLGNAGTAMRPLCGALAISEGEFVLTGEPRMKERPIKHLVDSLDQLGADITYMEADGYPPLNIKGKALEGGKVSIDGSISSQFLTAVLMIAPLLKSDTQINVIGDLVSKPYIHLTLDIISKFGITIENDNYQTFRIKGGQNYTSPGSFLVEGDASSASYFTAAAAIKGGTIRVTGIGKTSVQGDVQFTNVLEQMGAKIVIEDNYIEVTRGTLKGVDVDLNHIPDAAMTIAVAALFAEGKTTIRNIYNWRVKETDRLAAMACELRKVGAEVVEGNDYIEVTPPTQLKEAVIDTYDDHRMAMCFSLVALGDTRVTINDPGCTHKTFPTYFEALRSLVNQ